MKCKHCGLPIIPGDDWESWCHDMLNFWTGCPDKDGRPGLGETSATPPDEFFQKIRQVLDSLGLSEHDAHGFTLKFGMKAVWRDV